MGVEQAACSLISPDVPVDSLVADAQMPQTVQMPCDLLGAPLAAQQLFGLREVPGREAKVTAGARAAAVRPLLGGKGTVAAIRSGAVTADLAAHSRAVATERACDLSGVKPLPSEGGEHIPLSGGELAIRHDDDPLPGR